MDQFSHLRSRAALLRTIGMRLAGIAALSLLLGLTFNSGNPIGIRWSAASEDSSHEGSAPVPTSTTGEVSSGTQGANVQASPSASRPAVTSIHWPEVEPLLKAGKIVLVDSRPAKTFERYRIPGAVSLPYESNDEQLRAFREKHDTNLHLVVYCAGGSCRASTVLTGKLLQLGYNKVQVMDEGYFGWLAHTRGATSAPVLSAKSSQKVQPNVSSLSTPLPSEHSPDPPVSAPGDPDGANPSPTTWALVKPLLESGQVIMVDVRAARTFKAGHIPGAVNLAESAAQERDYLAFREKFGVAKPVVLYCSSLTCSVSKRMALRLVGEYGFQNVRYMTGGFQAWQRAELSPGKTQL